MGITSREPGTVRGTAKRPHLSLAFISVTVQLWTYVFWVISVYFNIWNTLPKFSVYVQNWSAGGLGFKPEHVADLFIMLQSKELCYDWHAILFNCCKSEVQTKLCRDWAVIFKAVLFCQTVRYHMPEGLLSQECNLLMGWWMFQYCIPSRSASDPLWSKILKTCFKSVLGLVLALPCLC